MLPKWLKSLHNGDKKMVKKRVKLTNCISMGDDETKPKTAFFSLRNTILRPGEAGFATKIAQNSTQR